jgi:hypothetical protein
MIRAMIFIPVIIMTVLLIIILVLDVVERYYYNKWIDEIMDEEDK